ncbi:MAG TPA: adenylyl-sulfate kinase [Actinobacteria bacterium]|nr:adenylyl-sulfate kinase [Actinomycetota bacterium]
MTGRREKGNSGRVLAADARRPTVIEFLGISGAGKSTLAAMATERLRQQGSSVCTLDEAQQLAFRGTVRDRFWRPVLRFLPAAISHRIWRHAFNRSQDRFLAVRAVMVDSAETVEVVMAATRRRRDFEILPDVVIGWWLNSLTNYVMVTSLSPPAATIVIDEGVINRAVSLFGFQFSEADRNDLERYLHSIPMPDLVIHIDTTPDVAEQRLSTWSKRFVDEDEATRRAFLEGSARCVAAIVQILETAEVPMAHIPAPDGSIAETSASLMEALDLLDAL